MTSDPTPRDPDSPQPTSSLDAVLAEAHSVNLSRRRRKPHQGPTPAAQPVPQEPQTVTPTQASEPEPAPVKRPTHKTRRATPKPARKSITFNIPEDLHTQINAFKHDTGRTSENLLLRALAMLAPHARQAVSDDLAEADPEAVQLAASQTGGFTITPDPRRTGARSQFGMRLGQDDIDRIDDLVESSGASDRGHLITLALRAYLQAHHSDEDE